MYTITRVTLFKPLVNDGSENVDENNGHTPNRQRCTTAFARCSRFIIRGKYSFAGFNIIPSNVPTNSERVLFRVIIVVILNRLP